MKKEILIGGVETFSIVDFPNGIAAVVFMQGCPWRCPFCYNTHLQEAGKETSFIWSKFFEFLEKRKGILDAVVFSGGEPLMQDELFEAMQEVKSLGYKIGMHTGGYRPKMLAKVLPMLSWVGFDIKAPFEESHYTQATKGKHLDAILESLDLLQESGINFECRTTCDPRLLSIEDIYTISDSLQKKGVKSYHLQKYRPIPSDTITKDEECEKFFIDEELCNHLKASFSDFDLRK